MKRCLGVTICLAFSMIFIGCKSSKPKAQTQSQVYSKEIIFISSDSELETAGANWSFFGLAVSVDYYKSQSQKNQERIKTYVEQLRFVGKPGKPIFVYGNKFDETLSETLLGKKVEGCKPMVFAMVRPGTDINGCGASDKPLTEDYFRKWIDEHWTAIIKQD